MKRFRNKYGLIGFLTLAAGYGLGPRIGLDENIRQPSLPADLVRYLNEGESRLGDITPGTEKAIVWANKDERGPTAYAIVYLHGFSASRQEIAPVCDIVAEALGANLFYTRLRGHGRSSDAMAGLSVNELLNDAVEALEIGKRLGNEVVLIGTSTGGALATWLAASEKSGRIAALVLLSPNFGPKRKESELLLLPWGNTILQLVEGSMYEFEPYSELQQRYWTTKYPSEALMAMMGVVQLARDKLSAGIEQPVLVMYAPDDQIVDSEAIQEKYSRFASDTKTIVAISDSGDPRQHILAGDALSPHTTEEVAGHIIRFIRQLL